ncbi:hypothetical protein J6590_102069 [Homalodisca vitripennis]|nr:hypothetical protein J6590_102069 [Homalodisca vitripennis]
MTSNPSQIRIEDKVRLGGRLEQKRKSSCQLLDRQEDDVFVYNPHHGALWEFDLQFHFRLEGKAIVVHAWRGGLAGVVIVYRLCLVVKPTHQHGWPPNPTRDCPESTMGKKAANYMSMFDGVVQPAIGAMNVSAVGLARGMVPRTEYRNGRALLSWVYNLSGGSVPRTEYRNGRALLSWLYNLSGAWFPGQSIGMGERCRVGCIITQGHGSTDIVHKWEGDAELGEYKPSGASVPRTEYRNGRAMQSWGNINPQGHRFLGQSIGMGGRCRAGRI